MGILVVASWTSVRWTLEKNILVPSESLFCNVSLYSETYGDHITSNSYKHKIVGVVPSIIKIGKFTVRDKEIILQNGDNMMKEVMPRRQRRKVYKELLFGNVSDPYITEKRNILGLMFSENLPNIRLPCNVFQQVRKLTANRGDFSAEEDKRILKFMASTTSTTPWLDLGRILERTESSIHKRYNVILKHQDKTEGYQQNYSSEENVKMMKVVFAINKNALVDNQIKASADVWKKLGEVLNKRPYNIYQHWMNFIHPTLVRYEAGVLDVDFRELLINYLVDNNIMYPQDANWDEIVKNPLFHGTTAAYLSQKYADILKQTKGKQPHLRHSEITTMTMQKYLHERRSYKPRKSKDVEKLIFEYQNLKFKKKSKKTK